jgi:hypothetical protein
MIAKMPTMDMLMSIILEAEMMDDLCCLNGHLRGQTFTPLHVDAGSGHSLVGGVSGDDSPQLSWSTTNGGSPLEITPQCFGLLDSIKSDRSFSSCSKVRSMARASLAIALTLPIATAKQCCCKCLLE